MTETLPKAEVLVGFESGFQAAMAMTRDAGHLSILLPGKLLDDFLVTALEECERVIGRGGRVRVLCLGLPSKDIVAEVVGKGAQFRVLNEGREVGMVVTDRAMLLFPPDADPETPLNLVSLHIQDLLALAHFSLAFEEAWGRAAPIEA